MLGIALLSKLTGRIVIWPLLITAIIISRPAVAGVALANLRIHLSPNVAVSMAWIATLVILCAIQFGASSRTRAIDTAPPLPK